LLTVEDHQLIGGMGSLLIHALMQEGVVLKTKSLGVKGEFGQSAYTALELYKKHGLDSGAIAAAAGQLAKA
jgi:transketolase